MFATAAQWGPATAPEMRTREEREVRRDRMVLAIVLFVLATLFGILLWWSVTRELPVEAVPNGFWGMP